MPVSRSLDRIRRLFGPEIRSQRWSLLLCLGMLVPMAALSGLVPLALADLVDRVIPLRSAGLILRHAALLAGLVLAAYALMIQAMRMYLRANEAMVAGFKLRLLEDLLQRKNAHVFTAYDPSELITRFSQDVDQVSGFFHRFGINAAICMTLAATVLLFMLAWNWELALMALAVVPLLLGLMLLFKPRILTRGRLAKQALDRQNTLLLDIFKGHGEIRFYQQFRRILALAVDRVQHCRLANLRFLDTFYRLECLIENIGSLTMLLPYVAGGLLYAMGHQGVTIGLMVAFNAYLVIFSETVQETAVAYNEFLRMEPSLDRLAELLDFDEAPPAPTMDVGDLPENNSIEFREVSFAYRQGEPVLSGLSFCLRPGEKVALMGASGRGKTTLVNLLLRQLTPTSGAILMGGRDIRDIPLPLFLYNISYVRQQAYLFRMSIRDNIAFGWGELPDDRLHRALRLVRLDDLVARLPQGTSTVVGGNGLALSGGERQRLALARALVREPQLLVLDEFTSALDQETEQAIVQDVLTLFRASTVLCITHSYGVARHFDRIIEL